MRVLYAILALSLAALIVWLFRRRHPGSLLDRKLVDFVLANPDPALLTPTLQDITVLRTNVDGMTRIFADLGDQPATALLNEYFAAIVPVIRRHNGVVVQFEFDKLFAIFGPIFDLTHADLAHHPASACRATLDLQQSLANLNASLATRNLPTLRMRIGVATGLAHVGDLGTPAASFFTAVGQPVTLAQTLERAARTACVSNLVSPETHARTRHLFDFRPIPPNQFFELLGAQRGPAEK